MRPNLLPAAWPAILWCGPCARLLRGALARLAATALAALTVTAQSAAPTSASAYVVPALPAGHRMLRSLSVHPDGRRWLFVECPAHRNGLCQVMRYDLDSGRLFRYALPDGYNYAYVRYSPKGDYVLIGGERAPAGGFEPSAVLARELWLMRDDGQGLQKVPARTGLKLAPAMSPDARHIAYWRSRGTLAHTQITGLEVWEFSCDDGAEHAFSPGRPLFLSAGPLDYRGPDEIVLGSYGTKARLMDGGFDTRYARSEVYRLRRAERGDLTPEHFAGLEATGAPSYDAYGNLFMSGALAQGGAGGLVRVAPDGARTLWRIGPSLYLDSLVAAQDGTYVALLYTSTAEAGSKWHNGFARFDLATAQWRAEPVPALARAEDIPVVAANFWCIK